MGSLVSLQLRNGNERLVTPLYLAHKPPLVRVCATNVQLQVPLPRERLRTPTPHASRSDPPRLRAREPTLRLVLVLRVEHQTLTSHHAHTLTSFVLNTFISLHSEHTYLFS